jgi:lipid II:glycine glycyltransferase (peptidoglycan interpeptide bridge formation enzyme)
MSGTVAISILAATNDEGRDLKVSHVMQWQVIQDCLTLGKNFYDTGGIDRAANPGVHLFKSGMGGFESTSAPTVERKPDTAVGRMTSLLESAYGLAKSRGYRR